jgi:hypothetical protein
MDETLDTDRFSHADPADRCTAVPQRATEEGEFCVAQRTVYDAAAPVIERF